MYVVITNAKRRERRRLGRDGSKVLGEYRRGDIIVPWALGATGPAPPGICLLMLLTVGLDDETLRAFLKL